MQLKDKLKLKVTKSRTRSQAISITNISDYGNRKSADISMNYEE